MGFFSKLKKGLGIGTAKVELMVEPSYSLEGGMIEGKMRLTAKSDQHILSLNYKLVKKVSRGRGDEKKTTDYTLGVAEVNEPFDIKEGEVREIPFKLGFAATKTASEAMQGVGGVVGALGTLGAAAASETIEYFVTAEADAKGVALDPSDTQRVNLI